MSQPNKKVRRLCERLNILNAYKTGQEFTTRKEQNVKVKSKAKKCAQGTFSMIKFYQSIPNYDEVRHLPHYDFSERVQLLKKLHCNLSGTLLRGPTSSAPKANSKRKTSGKKKKGSATSKNAISPSLCNSFSKASLGDLDEIDSFHKRSASGAGVLSLASVDLSTPPPLKRLQAFREKLLNYTDDWEYDSKHPYEKKCPTPKIPSPKLPSPKLPTPLCSPIHAHKLHHHPMHFHDFDYPIEHFRHHHHHLSHHNKSECFSSIHEQSPCHSSGRMRSPPKPATPNENKFEIKSPSCDIKCTESKREMRRAKSCPKDLFSISSDKCSENEKHKFESDTTNGRRSYHDDNMQYYIEVPTSAMSSRQRNSRSRTIPKIRIHKPKSKTPNSMDEYVSSKLVRSNHAAKLRQKSSRDKINELAEEKLKATMHVSKFIPKCHHWNVRDTPAWKTFLSEDLTIEKRLREEARQEEQKVRKHAHSMAMNIMRARVKSAQLLLEGRALSSKY